MQSILLKLIFRSWWRNKLFAVISIISLAVGLTCTNMLISYVLYELGIESDNPNKEHIIYMAQDSPMASGEQVSYIAGNIPIELKERYPEVRSFLRTNQLQSEYIRIGDNSYESPLILSADTTLTDLFSYQIVAGNLKQALSESGKIALTETYAQKLFGEQDPIGQMLFIYSEETRKETHYEVAAVIKEYRQSFLSFDAVVGNSSSFWGGPTLLLVNSSFNSKTFGHKLKEDHVPTLQGNIGQYYFYTLQESYFHYNHYNQESISYFNRNQKTLLYVGFFSALLILLIACFNYINLSFSRILQQVKMIYIEKLVGSTPRQIYTQLLADTFMTVLIAFGLSLLVTVLLLPHFNQMVSGRLTLSFFFSGQVLPLLVFFILLFSLLPANYMSHKIIGLSETHYRNSFTGVSRQRITATLSVIQFAISIGLLFALFTSSRQLHLIQDRGEGFLHLYEIADWSEDAPAYIARFAQEARRNPQIDQISLQKGSLFFYNLRQLIIKDEKGGERYYSMAQFCGDSLYLDLLHLPILQGLPIEKAQQIYKHPVYINETFARVLVPKGDNPVGKPVHLYDTDFGSMEKQGEEPTVIAGIIRDMHTHSLQEEVQPSMTYIQNDALYNSVLVRLPRSNQAESLALLKRCWEQVNPNRHVSYTDLYSKYLSLNQKTIEFFQLIQLYAIISLLLTASGLFGIVLYATEQRTKEIGIRKINGAGLMDILLLLCQQYLLWIAIAFALATPITWYLLADWLAGFHYRISISGWESLLAGITVLAITLFIAGFISYRIAVRNPVKALRSE